MQNTFDTKDIVILIIDDDDTARQFLGVLLKSRGYTTIEAESLSAGMNVLNERSVDLVLSDLMIGEESGLDVVKSVHRLYPDTETIVITGFGTIENAVEAIHSGAFDYITKPFANQHILLRVEKAVERRLMQHELTLLRQHVAMNYGFDNIVGISKVMSQLKETARRIAPTDITVLITGPSGTGKELLARAIHHHSNRRGNRFVAIDCSAIPDALLESELFGHTKGSFTSAFQDKKGLFEEADGGTVFLDEVSNMNLTTQAKLLRFLQDSEIRQVGAVESRKVNVRIVAATNRELKDMVKRGEFREDLYYRLNVIPLNVPSLNERAEDIEILVEYFLRKMSAAMGGRTLTITRHAVDKLFSHHWPGNVRELENALKRGAALCTGGLIDVDDIMFIASDRAPAAPAVTPTHTTLTLKGKLLDNSQRTLIVKALSDNEWNFTKTAADLGIGRTTLWRKVKKYNLQKDTEEPVSA